MAEVCQQQETKFEQWVKRFGVSRLVDEMRKRGADYAITYSAVYQWTRGEHEPRPKKTRALVEIAAGDITLQDVHDHFSMKAAAATTH